MPRSRKRNPMPDVRLLGSSETSLMLPGGREFFGSGHIYGKLNEDHFVRTMASYIETGAAFVVCKVEDGFLQGALGAAVVKDVATGDLTCSELFFHVTASKRGLLGIRLMAEAEKEARRRGARRMFMMHMMTPGAIDVGLLYERRGFALKEKIFSKEFYPSA